MDYTTNKNSVRQDLKILYPRSGSTHSQLGFQDLVGPILHQFNNLANNRAIIKACTMISHQKQIQIIYRMTVRSVLNSYSTQQNISSNSVALSLAIFNKRESCIKSNKKLLYRISEAIKFPCAQDGIVNLQRNYQLLLLCINGVMLITSSAYNTIMNFTSRFKRSFLQIGTNKRSRSRLPGQSEHERD